MPWLGGCLHASPCDPCSWATFKLGSVGLAAAQLHTTSRRSFLVGVTAPTQLCAAEMQSMPRLASIKLALVCLQNVRSLQGRHPVSAVSGPAPRVLTSHRSRGVCKVSAAGSGIESNVCPYKRAWGNKDLGVYIKRNLMGTTSWFEWVSIPLLKNKVQTPNPVLVTFRPTVTWANPFLCSPPEEMLQSLRHDMSWKEYCQCFTPN